MLQTITPYLPMPPNSGLQAWDKGLFARFGDGVVVTATGARRLGTRRFGAPPIDV